MEPSSSRSSSRRTYLRYLAAVGIGTFSGCVADESGSTTEAPSTTRGSVPTTSGPETTATSARSTRAATTRESVFPDYRTTEVTARTPAGERLGSVTAAIADTSGLRYTGLSDTPSLPADWGMLFVFETAGSHPFVMRGMSFGIDIVFADADRTITRIHHAPAPGPGEDGDDQRYPGSGQYVLEVNLDWTTDHGVSAGDVLEFDL